VRNVGGRIAGARRCRSFLSSREELVMLNGSLQTLQTATAGRVETLLSEVLEQFDGAAGRLGLDSGNNAAAAFIKGRTQSLREDVLQKVDSPMTGAFSEVHERAKREQVSVREGAYLIAVERVAQARREREWV
jgi:hypothetical protein